MLLERSVVDCKLKYGRKVPLFRGTVLSFRGQFPYFGEPCSRKKRLLSMWLDFGTFVAKARKSK